MTLMGPAELARVLRSFGVVPVVTIHRAGDARGLAEALTSGGLPVIEVTFRTSAAESSLARIRETNPSIVLGAGTVLDPDTVDRAIQAGAAFVVTPGFNPAVVECCLDRGIPVVPGVNSPTDVEMGRSRGLNLLKFFPAEASGGLAMVKALAAPYRDVEFMPTGGISPDNLGRYLAFDAVAACGGTWIASADDIQANRFDQIAANAREAMQLAAAARRATAASGP
jgi:2-dehydro-3-deoxyphosphogluconate aldolase/(4S)-4-hydroxy-2-oxoglutarate aldolase